ncbi:ribonuclease P protein component [Roseibacillus ishigakijimensis]|uniref:Ribonuclease P protein component n=1 Tax=Roseibacillus ishigakijimensis TaxID=454146 RepID=A0A934RQ46_9BACT|nr:ribonuclease P protein component [Roseibacillus ishigakijimensis]MBK1832476.1 ribonuclease P protein component [Roseibacillus ishigakijimensis]
MKLPRKLTLTDRADFQAVRTRGKSASSKHLVLATHPYPELDHWRYALITSKKAAARAHERNHIRRLIRAVLVAEGHRIPPGHHLVFIARWRAKDASYEEIRRDILYLLKKLGLRQDLPVNE